MQAQEVTTELSQSPPPQPSILGRLFSSGLLPVLVTGLLVLFCLAVAWVQFFPNGLRGITVVGSFGAPRVVSFDPVKFINAQRAAASILATKPNADLALTMTQVARQSQSVIREEAQGALVLIKQSLVLPEDVPDITDQVLQRFGLGKDVPTISTDIVSSIVEESIELYAPTDSSLSTDSRTEASQLEQREQFHGYKDQLRTLDAQRNLLP